MRPRSRMLALVATATLLLVPACGGDDDDSGVATTAVTVTTSPPTTEAAASTSARPIIVDTDLAADDIVALSYLTSRPDVDLLAVTVSGTGEIRCPRGADVARGLLARMGSGDVPVACGRSTPLAGDRTFPEPWRDSADNAYGLLLEMVTPPADQPDAATLLATTLKAAAQPVTVLTLGPLTNVAELLASTPDASANVARIVIMGGAVDVPGNVQPEGATEPLAAEWNVYVDPAAADAVIASGIPVTLVALDATNAVPVDDDVIARLAANDTTDATARVVQLFDLYPPPFLWDPLAAIAATEPDLVSTHSSGIAVITEGADVGRTMAADGARMVDVADPPDADAVLDHLLRTLAAVAPDEQLVTPTTLPILGTFAVGFVDGECTFDGPSELPAGRYQISSTPGDVQYLAVIAHFVGDATTQDALDWVAQHPDEEPPMVDESTAIGQEGESPTDVVLKAGNGAVVCFTEVNAVHVATDLRIT